MLAFEVAGDRNNFIDLQKIFLEIKCKIVQDSEADLKYDAGAAADVTKTDAPYICNNVLHSLFSDCTVSLKLNFLITKMLMQLGYHVKVIPTKRTPEQFWQLKLTDEKFWLDNLPNVLFMEK